DDLVTGVQTCALPISKVSDTGAVELAGLSQLRALNLSYTAVTDAGVESLCTLAQLRSLELDQTQLTDAGLRKVATLQHLEKLTRSEERRVGKEGRGRL